MAKHLKKGSSFKKLSQRILQQASRPSFPSLFFFKKISPPFSSRCPGLFPMCVCVLLLQKNCLLFHCFSLHFYNCLFFSWFPFHHCFSWLLFFMIVFFFFIHCICFFVCFYCFFSLFHLWCLLHFTWRAVATWAWFCVSMPRASISFAVCSTSSRLCSTAGISASTAAIPLRSRSIWSEGTK